VVSKIKLMLVDDDSTWLELIEQNFSDCEDILICGTAQTREQAVDVAIEKRPDVILMDMNLDIGYDGDGIYATKEILKVFKTKIIIFTSMDDENLKREAKQAGAIEYLDKMYYENLPEVVKEVHNKEYPPYIESEKIDRDKGIISFFKKFFCKYYR
jgi:DNA-binding NarL/FixJ family response regulator